MKINFQTTEYSTMDIKYTYKYMEKILNINLLYTFFLHFHLYRKLCIDINFPVTYPYIPNQPMWCNVYIYRNLNLSTGRKW